MGLLWGSFISFPILFELTLDPLNPPSPFKFNSSWLEDPSFLTLVRNTWIPLNENLPESPPIQFMENLKRVKKEMIAWRKEKKLQENQDLLEIEQQLKDWLEKEMDSKYSEEQK
jgi:hypothetical protein